MRTPRSPFSRALVAAVGVALVASALGLPAPAAASASGPAGTGAPAAMAHDAYASSAVLPFDMPSTSALRSSSKKVFANWVVSLPISFDNKEPEEDYYTTQYLDPNGENGKHVAYGGYLRDRPLGRSPRPGDWRLEDLKEEVRQAISVGIDGFTMVIYSIPDDPTSTGTATWNTARLMMQAAAAVDPGFKIIPMPDMFTMSTISSEKLADAMKHLASYSSIYRLTDGRALFSPFFAEKRTADWWSGWLTTMRTTKSTPAALWPTFLNEQNNRDAFGPIMVGTSNWGARHPDGNPTSWATGLGKWRIGQIHDAGQQWMQPVSIQDDRPRKGKFVEAENMQNLRNTWDIAIDGGADWVQLLTWNDLPESTGILPSLRHGWTFLDLMAYYVTWFKTGSAPTIKRDAIYLTHRSQWAADEPSFPQTILSENVGSTPTRDAIEAMVFLTAPATITIKTDATSFTCSAPAGLSTCVAPLGAGTVSAEAHRSGTRIAGVTSPSTVSHTPYVQDLQYIGASSLRNGFVPRGTEPGTPPTAATSEVSLTPVADTYVDENAPSNNFDWSSQMMARGTKGSRALLRFDLPAAPTGMTLSSATLAMRTTTGADAGSAAPAAVTTFGGTWSEQDVTWGTRPQGPATTVGSFPAGTAPDTAYRVEVGTGELRAAQGGSINLAVESTSTDNLRLWSTGHASERMHPELVLTYTQSSGPTPGSTPTTRSLRPLADTYANAMAPDKNYGWSSQLVARGGAKGSNSYLRFAVPQAPAGTTLGSATLKVRTSTADQAGSAAAATVSTFTASWSEDTMTWQNRPTTALTDVGTLPAGTVRDAAYSVSLSADAIAAQGSTLDLAITSTSPDDLQLWGTGHVSQAMHPELVLSYVPVASTTSHRPSGDTYADENAPDKNYDWSSMLMARGGAKGASSYLRFDLPSAPAGSQLTSATLIMRTTTADQAGSAATATVSTLSSSWSPGNLTWNNLPGGPLQPVGTFPAGTVPDSRYSVVLTTADVAAALGGTLDLAITSASTDNLQLWSTGHAADSRKPELVLTYG